MTFFEILPFGVEYISSLLQSFVSISVLFFSMAVFVGVEILIHGLDLLGHIGYSSMYVVDIDNITHI